MENEKKAIETAINEAVKSIVELMDDTVNYGFTIQEAFPAESYKLVKINGKDYRMKFEVSLKEIKW